MVMKFICDPDYVNITEIFSFYEYENIFSNLCYVVNVTREVEGLDGEQLL